MKEIDWSKAPEGAIGAFIKDKGCEAFFVASKNVSDHLGRQGFEGEKCDGGQYHVFTEDWTWFERPAVWTGGGLPPVGTVCELACRVLLAGDLDAKWFEVGELVECAGHVTFAGAEGPVCVLTDHAGESYTGTISDKALRPRRTPEQIAAEERERELADMREIVKQAHYALLNTEISPSEKAAAYVVALYDAGYRKQ